MRSRRYHRRVGGRAPRDKEIAAAEIPLGSPPAPPGDLPAAVCYPNSYRVGMASLGFQLVWGMFDGHGAFDVDRYFDASISARGRDARPCGLRTGRPLGEARVIAFSLYYELDYVTACRMLVTLPTYDTP